MTTTHAYSPTEADARPGLYSYRSAARYLSLSHSTVKELALRGDLVSIKVGRRRLFPRESLDEFIRERLA